MVGTTGDGINPHDILSIYNPADLVISNTSALTISNGDERYLKISGGVATGLLTCNSSLAVTGTLTLNGEELGTELGYLDVTPGTAEAEKALVLDASSNITGINGIGAGYLSLTSSTSSTAISARDSSMGDTDSRYIILGKEATTYNQALLRYYHTSDGSESNYLGLGMQGDSDILKISASGVVDIPGHDGSADGLSLGGTLITSTATELNYLDGITPGTVTASKALVVDASKDISSLGAIGAGSLTLSSHVTNYMINALDTDMGNGDTRYFILGKNTSTYNRGFLSFYYESSSNANNYIKIGMQSVTCFLQVKATGTVNIYGHNGTTQGLSLSGTLITSTAAELNILDGCTATAAELNLLDGSTAGTAVASTALVVDSNKDIADIRAIGAGYLSLTSAISSTAISARDSSMGDTESRYIILGKEATTYNQALIRYYHTSDDNSSNYLGLGLQGNSDVLKVSGTGVVDMTDHNGTDKGLSLGGTLVTSTAAELNLLDGSTAGTVVASKALVVDSNKDISGLGDVSMDSLTIISTSGSNVITALDSALGDGTNRYILLGKNSSNYNQALIQYYYDSSASTNNALFLKLQGGTAYFKIGYQTIDIGGHDGGSVGLALGGTLITATAAELNILDTCTATATELNYLAGITPGTVTGSKALVVDASKHITGLGDITAETLTLNTTANEMLYLTDSTMGDASQKYILIGKNSSDYNRVLIKYYYYSTSNINNYLSFSLQGGDTTLRIGSKTINITGHNGTDVGLSLAGTLITATAPELNILDGCTATSTELNYLADVTAGTAAASKALVLDANKDIGDLRYLTAETLTLNFSGSGYPLVIVDGALLDGESRSIIIGKNASAKNRGFLSFLYTSTGSVSNHLKFAIQDNYTSLDIYQSTVDISTHNGSDKGLSLNGTLITASAAELNLLDDCTCTTTELNYCDVTPGTGTASKAVVLDSNKDIADIRGIGAGYLNLTSATSSTPIAARDSSMTTGTSRYIILGKNTSTYNQSILRYYHGADGNSGNYLGLGLQGNSDIVKVVGDGSVDITDHDGSTTGLKLNGTLITKTAAEINALTGDENVYLTDITPGTCSASKALVVDANKDIASIREVSASYLELTSSDGSSLTINALDSSMSPGDYKNFNMGYDANTNNQAKYKFVWNGNGSSTNYLAIGTQGWAEQIKMTAAGVVDIPYHNGSDRGLSLTGTLVTSSAAELNTLDGVTAGAASASKAVVLDSNKDVSGLGDVSANTLSATTHNSNVMITSLDSAMATTNERYIKLGKANSSRNCADIKYHWVGDNSTDNYIGFGFHTYGNILKIQADQTVDISPHNGSTTGLMLNDILVEASATELNYLTISPGSATAMKAVVLDVNKDFDGINDLTIDGTLTLTDSGASTSHKFGTTNNVYLNEFGYSSDTLSGLSTYTYYTTGDTSGEVETPSGSANISGRMSGRLLVSGEVDVLSSRDVKENIVDLDEDKILDFVSKTKPKSFNKQGDKITLGLIAQDIVKNEVDLDFHGMSSLRADESAPLYHDLETGIETHEGTRFTLNYSAIATLALAHSKILAEQIEALTQQNMELIARIEALEKKPKVGRPKKVT